MNVFMYESIDNVTSDTTEKIDKFIRAKVPIEDDFF